MNANELREIASEDLSQKLIAVMEELFRLKIKKNTGHTVPLHRFKELRKIIARMKTVLHEKNRLASV